MRNMMIIWLLKNSWTYAAHQLQLMGDEELFRVYNKTRDHLAAWPGSLKQVTSNKV